MKVKLKEGKELGFERPIVSFVFKHPRFPMQFDRAIVDTGCPFVIIPESTLKLRRIPFNSCPKYDKIVQIGNIPFELRDMGECSIKFIDVDGIAHEFKHTVYAGIPQIPIMQKLPSFIGLDFLRKFKLSLCPKDDGMYLEGPSPSDSGSCCPTG